MTGEHWYDTFARVFAGSDRTLIVSVLDTICKAEHKDGMVAAAKIVAFYEPQNEEVDSMARAMAREIMDEAIA